MTTNFRPPSSMILLSSKGAGHKFSAHITPQHNGVVERKKRTLQELTRVMLHANNLPYYFQAEAMNTGYHIHNRELTIFRLKPRIYLTMSFGKVENQMLNTFMSLAASSTSCKIMSKEER